MNSKRSKGCRVIPAGKSAPSQRRAPGALPLVVVLAVALSLAACGRKGPLEPHPDEPKAPAAAGTPATSSKQGLGIGNSRRQLSSPIKPPDRKFILDPLL